MTKEITRQLSPLVKKAQNFEITSALEMKEAVIMLSELNKYSDRINLEKEKITKPLNEALKAERNRWKSIEIDLNNAIDITRKIITTYQTTETARVQKEAEKIATRTTGGFLLPETAIRKLDEIKKPEEVVATNSGEVQFATTKKFEVINISLVPTDYLIANEPAIRVSMKNGIELPGIRYWTEEVPRNYR